MWQEWGWGKVHAVCGGETWRKRPLGKPRSWWEDNIKMDVTDLVWGTWTWLIWFRIWTVGERLWMRSWTFGFRKRQEMSRLADDWLDSEEGLCCTGSVSCAKQNTILSCHWGWKNSFRHVRHEDKMLNEQKMDTIVQDTKCEITKSPRGCNIRCTK